MTQTIEIETPAQADQRKMRHERTVLFKRAVEFVALNDEPHWINIDDVGGQLTVQLIAETFRMDAGIVAAHVLRTREIHFRIEKRRNTSIAEIWRVTFYKEGEPARIEDFGDKKLAYQVAEEWENPHAHAHVPTWATVTEIRKAATTK